MYSCEICNWFIDSCDCDFFVIPVIHLIVNVVGAGTVWKRNGKENEKRKEKEEKNYV